MCILYIYNIYSSRLGLRSNLGGRIECYRFASNPSFLPFISWAWAWSWSWAWPFLSGSSLLNTARGYLNCSPKPPPPPQRHEFSSGRPRHPDFVPGHGVQSTEGGAIPIAAGDYRGEARSGIPGGLLGPWFHPEIPKSVGPHGGAPSRRRRRRPRIR